MEVGDGGLLGNNVVISTDKGVAVGGTFTVASTGNVTLDGGTLNTGTTDATAGSFNWVSGTYGTGTHVGSLSNAGGTLSPGNSPGLTEVTGDYDQGPAGSLLIEILGTTAASQYDVVDVTGSATLDGLLEVVLLDGYIPNDGDSFDILIADTIVGGFSTLTLPSLSGMNWELETLVDAQGSDDILRLSVLAVPEPTDLLP